MARTKAIPSESFDFLRQKIAKMAPWYFIDKNGFFGIADTDMIDAAFEENLWGDFPKKVFVLGFPEAVSFEQVINGRSGMISFRKYEDDMYFFVEDFEIVEEDGIQYSDANWYFE